MKLTFAYWGNYTLAFNKLIERLGFEYIPPEDTNSTSIKEGAKLSPEMFCLPLKVNIGNYLSAIKNGADTILMWENIGGSCRLRYYWVVQEKTLRDAGYDIKVINLNSRNLFSKLREISKDKIHPLRFLRAILSFFRDIRFIDKLEVKTNYLRPREKNKGDTEKILKMALERFREVRNKKELASLQRDAWNKFSQIKTDRKRMILRLGVIGEVYTISDDKVNFELDKKLGEMGVEVHRELNLVQHLISGFFWKEKMLQKKVNQYLKTTVGGHGRQAIAEMLDYSKKGFDGVIQILPFGCMPEVTVRPILQKISQEKRIPFLSISLDEQTAEAGIQTRLEAFVDLMKSRHTQLKSNHAYNSI